MVVLGSESIRNLPAGRESFLIDDDFFIVPRIIIEDGDFDDAQNHAVIDFNDRTRP